MRVRPLNLDQPYLGTAEIAALLGVSKQRLTNLVEASHLRISGSVGGASHGTDLAA
jgi:hypothetical protein